MRLVLPSHAWRGRWLHPGSDLHKLMSALSHSYSHLLVVTFKALKRPWKTVLAPKGPPATDLHLSQKDERKNLSSSVNYREFGPRFSNSWVHVTQHISLLGH